MENSNPHKQRPKPIEGAGATLFLGKNMITRDMNKQIQLASQAPEMIAYIRKRFGWSRRQYHSANMAALGRVKGRFKLHRSIRTTKLLYDWLNVGVQKRDHHGEDATCPCCGKEDEDWLHLFRCTNEKMSASFREAIGQAKSEMVASGIPSPIYNAYVDALCTAAQRDHPDRSYCPTESTKRVLEKQASLGATVILKGIQHNTWRRQLQRAWIPPPPRADGTTSYKKDINEQAAVLVKTTWDIFEKMWSTRNDILHGEESQIQAKLEEQKLTRLLEFKNNKMDMLRRCDHFLVETPVADMVKWTTRKRRQLVEILERLHKVHLTEYKLAQERQRPITQFFQIAAAGP